MLTLGNGQSWWPLLLFVGLAGLSDGIGGLVVGAKAGDLFPTTSLGVVMGLVQMGRGLGIMAGPIVGGLLFDLQGNYRRSYWIPGSYAPTLSKNRNSFLRLLKNKGFKEERMTKVGLYAIDKSTTLESNKSQSVNGSQP